MEKNLSKTERSIALTARYSIATSRVIPGLADEALIDELMDVARVYEELINEGLPRFDDVNRELYKVADCKERVASIYSWRGELHQAKHYYEEAMKIFEAIGNSAMVENCRVSLRSLLLRGEGNVDEEIQRLYAALENTAPGSLQHVELLSDLGSLLVTAGDDFEAQRYLHAAEREMLDIGHPFPSVQELQALYWQMTGDVSPGEAGGEPSYMPLLRVTSIYRRIYQILLRIYERVDSTKAEEYSERIGLLNRSGFDPLSYEQQVKERAERQRILEEGMRRQAEVAIQAARENESRWQEWQDVMEQIEQIQQTTQQTNSNNEVVLDQLLAQLDVSFKKATNEGTTSGLPFQGGVHAENDKRSSKRTLVDPLLLRQELDALGMESAQRPEGQSLDDLMQKVDLLETQARQMGNRDALAVALLHRADLLLKLRRDEEALATLQEALLRLGEVGRYDLEVYIVEKRARIYARLQDWQAVSSTCEAGIQLVEDHRYKVTSQYMQSGYLRSRISLYVLGVRSAYLLKDYALMLKRAELSKSRFSLRYHQQTLPDESQEETLQKFQLVQKEIEEARGLAEEELLNRRRVLWEILDIQRFHARPNERLIDFSLPRVQSVLDEDEAILYYYWLDNESLLIVTIDRQSLVAELIPLDQAQHRQLERLAQVALTQRRGRELRQLEVVPQFSQLLLPQEGRRVLEGKQRLLLSPHKVLHTLPFHALYWKNEPLIQRFAVTYIPNLSSLLLQYTVSHKPQHVLTLGVRDYAIPNHPLPPLLDAEQEVEDIKSIYESNGVTVTALQGKEVRLQQLKQLEANRVLEQYTCVHFATHGENIDSDTPMESYLCLRDSVLEGLTIANWHLGADIVVLSACSSGQRPIAGRGMAELPGDELFGLQAAFFATGARRLLCSLWAVDSPAAPLSMNACTMRPPGVRL